MILHVIEAGETVNTIARTYDISPSWLIRENGISDPRNLVVGSVLVILIPEITHTIEAGDTLESIANEYNVTVMDLLRNNSYLADQEMLIVGDWIVIKYTDEKIGSLSVVGYAYPFIDINVLRKTLPYLTYLVVYGYFPELNADFREIQDTIIIQYAKAFGVAPIMFLGFQDQGEVSGSDIVHQILMDASLQEKFINNVITFLKDNGYLGLSISVVYIYPQDRPLYVDFMGELIRRVREEGFIILDTLIPTIFQLISEVYEVHNYLFAVNALVDRSILFPSSVGLTLGAPTGSVNFNLVQDYFKYFTTYIPPEKLLFGISATGYMWELPYRVGISEGNAISASTAMQLAADFDIPILYDNSMETAYFIFCDENKEFMVQFKDARSVVAYMDLVNSFGLSGIGVWSVMSFFNGLWLVVNSQYVIEKLDIDI